MVHEHHAEQPFAPEEAQLALEFAQLRGAESPGRHARACRQGARGAHHGQRSAAANQGKIAESGGFPPGVAAGLIGHIAGPMMPAPQKGQGDVSIVVPRHHGHPVRCAEPPQPIRCHLEFARQGDVHQVARHHHMVGLLGLQVFRQAVEHVGAVNALAPMLPGEVAEQPLVHQLADARARQRRNVGIREVRQPEHGLAPGPSESAPPRRDPPACPRRSPPRRRADRR